MSERSKLDQYILNSHKRVANWSKAQREAFIEAIVAAHPNHEASIREQYEGAYQESLAEQSLRWLMKQRGIQ